MFELVSWGKSNANFPIIYLIEPPSLGLSLFFRKTHHWDYDNFSYNKLNFLYYHRLGGFFFERNRLGYCRDPIKFDFPLPLLLRAPSACDKSVKVILVLFPSTRPYCSTSRKKRVTTRRTQVTKNRTCIQTYPAIPKTINKQFRPIQPSSN